MKKNIQITTIRVVVFNLLFILYLLQLILPIPGVELILSLLCFFALLLSIPGTPIFYKIIILAALSFSLMLMVDYDLFTWDAVYYFSSLTNVLVLIAYAPLISIPVRLGAYPQKIYYFFKPRITSMKGLYAMYSTVTFFLSSIMGVAAIPLSQSTLVNFIKNASEDFQKKFQTLTFVRPYIMTLFWTPVAVAPTIVIAGTHSNPIIVLSITFTIALILLISDMMISYKKFENVNKSNFFVHENNELSSTSKHKFALIVLLCSIFAFCMIVLALNNWFDYSMIDAVVLTVIPFSLCWSYLLKKPKTFTILFKSHLKQQVPKTSAQVALFVTIGLMINVIEQTQLSGQINDSILFLKEIIGPFVLLVIGLIVFALTWIGIIPQLVVVLVTQTINIEVIGIMPEWFAIAILGAALTGSASSPFTVNANVVAVTINDTPMNVVKRNIFFALSIIATTSVISILLQYLIS
ncbi:hypothetical protein [Halalkalibacterium ligniniphilum]|uniref:hypothetical protein n=1 Tax=Halalkalibacterium ligniniphilum TaxID=1134413 RepID=UPI0003472D14|nr:hypothetical protein [Halalkalibacterium ligniniphilum]